MIFRKLKRTWSHGYANHIPGFKETFPELNDIDSEELSDRFIKLGLDFYTEKKTPVNILVRLTLPFAVITMLFMLIFMPINFLLTGHWGYSLGNKNRVLNWFRSLGLQ
jgi:hypothetical protein